MAHRDRARRGSAPETARRMRSTRCRWLAAIATVAAAWIAFGFLALRANPSATTANPSPSASAFGIPALVRLNDPTRALVYRLLFKVRADLDTRVPSTEPEQGQGAVKQVSWMVAGSLSTTLLGADAQRRWVLHRLAQPQVEITVGGARASTDSAEGASCLEGGWAVEMESWGRVVSVRIPSERCTVMGRSLVRALTASMQVTLPDGPAREWQVTETDKAGPHLARYGLVDDALLEAGTVGMRKHKIRSGTPARRAVVSPGSVLEGWQRETGAAEIDFDAKLGEVEAIGLEEESEALVGAHPVSHTVTTLTLELSGRRFVPSAEQQELAAAWERLRKLDAIALDSREAIDAAHTNLARQAVGAATFEQILGRLDSDPNSPEQRDGPDPRDQLAAYVFLHPEQLDRLAAMLRTLPPKGFRMRGIVSALVQNGSPAAQMALISALRSRRDLAGHKDLVFALALGDRPIPEAVDAVRATTGPGKSEEQQRLGHLCLGIMAHTLESQDPARAAQLVEEQIALLSQSAADVSRTVLHLQALGNAGATRSLDALLRMSKSETAAVRAEAVFSLRFIARAEAEDRIVEALGSEAERSVRIRAAEALRYRAPSARTFEQQRERLRLEADSGVRATLLRNVWGLRREYEQAVEAVRDRSLHDPDEEIRKHARNMLVAVSGDSALQHDSGAPSDRDDAGQR